MKGIKVCCNEDEEIDSHPPLNVKEKEIINFFKQLLKESPKTNISINRKEVSI